MKKSIAVILVMLLLMVQATPALAQAQFCASDSGGGSLPIPEETLEALLKDPERMDPSELFAKQQSVLCRDNKNLRYDIVESDGVPHTVVYGSDEANGHVEIPAVIYGGSVKEIGLRAFAENKNITSVFIEEGVLRIENRAFMRCEALTGQFTIPQSVTELGDAVFSNSKITGLAIPKTTDFTSITFANCNHLKKVYYGGSRTEWERRMEDVKASAYTEGFLNATVYFVNEDRNADVDFDGVTNMTDTFRIYHSAAGKGAMEWYERAVTDYNDNGKLDMADAMYAYALAAGKR